MFDPETLTCDAVEWGLTVAELESWNIRNASGKHGYPISGDALKRVMLDETVD